MNLLTERVGGAIKARRGDNFARGSPLNPTNPNHEGHENHEKEPRRSRLGSNPLCGTGTARCSYATREVSACAGRMHSANDHSPAKPVGTGHPDSYLSFVDFVLFVVKVGAPTVVS